LDIFCCKFNDFLSKSPNFDKYSFLKILIIIFLIAKFD
jgi:hypothetical protein